MQVTAYNYSYIQFHMDYIIRNISFQFEFVHRHFLSERRCRKIR